MRPQRLRNASDMLVVDAMRDILARCRRSFGEPPRRLRLTKWADVAFDPPPWLGKHPDVAHLKGIAIDAWLTYEGQRELRRHGRVVWGAIVQANAMLFQPGPDDLPGAIVYSEDPHFEDAPQELQAIADRISGLYQGNDDAPKPPMVPGLESVLAALASGDGSVQHVRLPGDITGGRAVFATYIFVPRRYLPERHLASNVLPVIVAPERTVAVTPLPQQFWPDDFVSAWASGSPFDRRPAAEGAQGYAPGGKSLGSMVWEIPADMLGVWTSGLVLWLVPMRGTAQATIGILIPVAFGIVRDQFFPDIFPTPRERGPRLGLLAKVGAYARAIFGGVVALLAGLFFYAAATEEAHAERGWPVLVVALLGAWLSLSGVRRLRGG